MAMHDAASSGVPPGHDAQGQSAAAPVKKMPPVQWRSVEDLTGQPTDKVDSTSHKVLQTNEENHPPQGAASNHQVEPIASSSTSKPSSGSVIVRKVRNRVLPTEPDLRKVMLTRKILTLQMRDSIIETAMRGNEGGLILTELHLQAKGLVKSGVDRNLLQAALLAAHAELKEKVQQGGNQEVQTALAVVLSSHALGNEIVEIRQLLRANNDAKILEKLKQANPQLRSLAHSAYNEVKSRFGDSFDKITNRVIEKIEFSLVLGSIDTAKGGDLKRIVTSALVAAMAKGAQGDVRAVLDKATGRIKEADIDAIFQAAFRSPEFKKGSPLQQKALVTFFEYKIALAARQKEQPMVALNRLYWQGGEDPLFHTAFENVLKGADTPLRGQLKDSVTRVIEKYGDKKPALLELGLRYGAVTQDAKVTQEFMQFFPDKVKLASQLAQLDKTTTLLNRPEIEKAFIAEVDTLIKKGDLATLTQIYGLAQTRAFVAQALTHLAQQYALDYKDSPTPFANTVRALCEKIASPELNKPLAALRDLVVRQDIAFAGNEADFAKAVAYGMKTAIMQGKQTELLWILEQAREQAAPIFDQVMTEISGKASDYIHNASLLTYYQFQIDPSQHTEASFVELCQVNKANPLFREALSRISHRDAAAVEFIQRSLLQAVVANPDDPQLVALGLAFAMSTNNLLAAVNLFNSYSGSLKDLPQFVSTAADFKFIDKATAFVSDPLLLPILSHIASNDKTALVDSLKAAAKAGKLDQVVEVIDHYPLEVQGEINSMLEANQLATRPILGAFLRKIGHMFEQTDRIDSYSMQMMMKEMQQTLCNPGSLVSEVTTPAEFPILHKFLKGSDRDAVQFLADIFEGKTAEQNPPITLRSLQIELVKYRDILLKAMITTGREYEAAPPEQKEQKRADFIEALTTLLPIYPSAMISISDMVGLDESVRGALRDQKVLQSPFTELMNYFQSEGWAMVPNVSPSVNMVLPAE